MNIKRVLYEMGDSNSSPDYNRIRNSIVFEESQIAAQELIMEDYWLQAIYKKHNVDKILSDIGIEISQNFRAMRINYGLTSALNYYGIHL